ncbi:MAG: amidohydrolase [Flavobacteriales bacterium]|nr:amidohydrolase [Flavobacteriales bacterium]
MQDLRVTLVQSMLHWEDAEANCAMFSEKLAPLQGSTDLIVLPEMFSTGFSMRSHDLSETMDGATIAWMRGQAKRCDAAIYGSIIIEDDGERYNRGLFVRPDGMIDHYDKRHLFRMADEQKFFAAGSERVVVEWRNWRILLQVCYDLRFPVFSRNRGDVDAMLYVANWPEARRYPWSQLLIARAIENQAYVVGVNRVGMDGKGHHYSGDSVAIDPRGEQISRVTPSEEGIATALLDRTALQDFRGKFPAGQDADIFRLDL